MKFLILLILSIFVWANQIYLENCKIKKLDLSKIPKKYFVEFYKKAPLDKKAHKYIGITLKNLEKLIGNANELSFLAYDDYKTTFNKKEINSPYILFVFYEDNKPIPISKRGPAKIIYLIEKNEDYFFKSIFLIKKVICEN